MYLEVHEKFSKIGMEKLRNALKSTSSRPRAPQNDGVAEFDVEKLLPGFFLGNWLTDVSQVVDPVAYARACKFIEKIKITLADLRRDKSAKGWLKNTLIGLVSDKFKDDAKVDKFLDLLQDLLTKSEPLDKNPGSNYKSTDLYIGDFLRDLIFIQGFFKFVRPVKGDYHLPFKCYEHVYKRLFREYPGPGVRTKSKDKGTTSNPRDIDELFTHYNPFRHFDRWPSPDPDHQEGLNKECDIILRRHNHIETAVEYLAAIYTIVDNDWAIRAFTGQLPKDIESAKEWCYHLALLGTASHTTEDFFAHTNYVEEVLQLANLIPGDKKEAELHDRRRRHFSGTTGNADGSAPYELNIVGGYFDFTDTLWSVSSLLGEHLGEQKTYVPDLGEDYMKVLHAMDTISLKERDEFSKVLKSIGWIYDENIVQQEIIDACYRVWELNQAFKMLNPWNWTLFESLRNISNFLYRVMTMEILKDLYLDHLMAFLKEDARKWFGANRLGCHTLMNKDGDGVLHYEHAESLACGLHAYIIETLTRWKDIPEYYCSGQSHNIYTSGPVDWKQLLDYFLCHPERISNGRSDSGEMVFLPYNIWYEPQSDKTIDVVNKMKIGGQHGHLQTILNPDAVDARIKAHLEKIKPKAREYNGEVTVKTIV